MDKKQSKLIVIDGIDGAGKTTQINLLAKALQKKNILYEVISFPRYENNMYGKLIRKYLSGEFGSIDEVNPYLISLLFAGDRFLAKKQIEKWLSEGKVVLANRYISASKAHLAANVAYEKRAEFIKWIDELEYKTNGLPREDLTILLNVDPKVGQSNVISKLKPDIHEKNLKHLEQASKIYLELAAKNGNWYVIDCMQDSHMRLPQDIHQEVMEKLQMFDRSRRRAIK